MPEIFVTEWNLSEGLNGGDNHDKNFWCYKGWVKNNFHSETNKPVVLGLRSNMHHFF